MARVFNSRARTRAVIVLVFAAGCVESSRGCEPGWQSEREQIAFYDSTVIKGGEGYFSNDGPLLVGTVICPRIDCVRPEIEDEDNPPLDLCPTNPDENQSNAALLACFDQEVFGASLVGGCVNFDTPGSAVWSFTPRNCDATMGGFTPESDQVTYDVVDAEDVRAWFRPDADLWALDNLVAAPGHAFPKDAVRERGEAVKLIADAPVRLPVVLESPQGDVGWQTRQPDGFGGSQVASLTVQTLAGDPAVATITGEGAAQIQIAAGARARLILVTAVAEFDLGEIEGVAASDIESLELVVGYGESEEEPPSPAGARAILRDAANTPVYGARIEWEVVEGRLGLDRAHLSVDGQPDPDEPDCEYMLLAGDCYQEPYRDALVRAQLAARFGELEDVTTLEWVIAPGDGKFYDDFASVFGGVSSGEKPPTQYPCEGPGALGCECSSRENASPAGGLGILFGLALLRRRRR